MVGVAAPVVRFNSTVTSSTGATKLDTVIYYLASSTGSVPFSLIRRECQSGLLTSAVVLASNVASANVACLPTATPNCSGEPESITATITETPDSNGTVFSFTLTGTFQKLVGDGAPPPPASVISLGTDGACVGTPGATGISLTGGARLSAYGGAVYVDAVNSGSCTAMNMDNGGAFTHLGTTAVLAGGSCTGNGCPTTTPYSPTITDPYKTLGAPSTAGMTNFSSSACSGTLQPGNYTSGLSITTGPCTLATGIYVVQGGLTVSNGASLASAGGVLIYVKGGTFSVGGGSPVTLSAMTSGPYAGLVLWQATLSSTILLNNNGQIALTGTLYAPGAQLNVQAASVSATTIVVRTIVMANNGSVTSGAPVSISSPAALPDSLVGLPYPATTMGGTGGGGDYAWSATGLPVGIAIDATTGVVSGTPSASGIFSVVVTLSDSVGDSSDARATRSRSILRRRWHRRARARVPRGRRVKA